MAACGSLQHIFEKPLPENPTLLESLSSWKQQMKPLKPIEDSSFTEIFGELHFKENPELSKSTSPPPPPPQSSSSFGNFFTSTYRSKYDTCPLKKSETFSPMNSESLHFCTEGLGFESSDDVEDSRGDINNDWKCQKERPIVAKHAPPRENLRSKTRGGALPPPISCISKTGKPWVCFKSYRQDGRFVLKEIRIPTQEVLHAYREDGRLKLQFVQSDDEILEQDEEDEDDDEVDGGVVKVEDEKVDEEYVEDKNTKLQ